MAIKPILFNYEMVRAILDGRQDATRRIVKGVIPDDAVWGYTAFTPKGYISCRGTFADGYGEKFFKLPCEPGDILYVRETWGYPIALNSDKQYVFRADEVAESGFKNDSHIWHPSIHMPKEAARIWLKVMNVRVERLQDIDEDGVWNEGFRFTPPCLTRVSADGHTCDLDGPCTSHIKYCDMTMGELFGRELWNSTIKKSDIDRHGWDANPWVWVIEFERCEKPKGV